MRLGTVVPLAVAASTALLGDQMLYTVLPAVHSSAGIGIGALGVMLSVHRFIRLAANPLGGVLYDRWGRRRPFLLGMLLAMLSTSGYLLADGFWPLLAARLVWGCAWALLAVGGATIVFDLTTAADRGRMLGVYHSLTGVGTLIGLLASGILTDMFGYRATLAVFAPLTGLGGLVAFICIPETSPRHAREARNRHERQSLRADAATGSDVRTSGVPGDPAGSGRRGGRARTVRAGVRMSEAWSRLRADRMSSHVWPSVTHGLASFRAPLAALGRAVDGRVAALVIATFVNFFANHGVLSATLGAYVKQAHDSGLATGLLALPAASLTGVLLAARRATTMVAGPVAGWISDVLGDRRLVAAAGALAAAGGFTVLMLAAPAIGIPSGVLLAALGEGVLGTALGAWAGDVAPAHLRGRLMGAFATVNDLGGATGPLVGYALGTTHGFGAAYALGAALLGTAFAVLLTAPGSRAAAAPAPTS